MDIEIYNLIMGSPESLKLEVGICLSFMYLNLNLNKCGCCESSLKPKSPRESVDMLLAYSSHDIVQKALKSKPSISFQISSDIGDITHENSH